MRSTSIPKLVRRKEAGFTLVELLLALLLLSSLTAFSLTYLAGNIDEGRFLQTRERMLQLRRALVGDPSRRQGSVRSAFGYHGDVGALPAALSSLATNPGLPAWATNAAARFGLGWGGDYLGPANLGANYAADAWGNGFVYAPAASPPTLTSYGADRAAGGAGLAADLVMPIPDAARLATVHGVIVSSGAPYTGLAQVELSSVDGTGNLVTTLQSVVASDRGYFTFGNVPQGTRSVKVYVPSKAAATITVGPVAFTVDRPHYLINTKYLDVGVIQGPTNIEVPLEMLDIGLSSNIINLFSSFERSRTLLNTADYDGTAVTYNFEIVATNAALLGIAVNLVNSAGTVVASLGVGGLTTTPTRYRTTFTPTAGSNDYRIQLPLTLLLNQVTVSAARIIVQQQNATKTRIYVPLIGDLSANTSNSDTATVDTTTSTTYTQATPLEYSIWLKNAGKLSLATSTPNQYVFAASLASSTALGTASAALYNRTTGAAVTGAVASKAGTGFALIQAPFADTAANFTDLNEFEVRLRSTTLATASIARAGLYIKLENLGRGEAYYRVARAYSGTASAFADNLRMLLNSAAFSNPVYYSEAVGSASAAGVTNYQLYDAGTADSGTGGTAIAAATATLPAAKTRLRSGAFTLTPGNRAISRATGNGTATMNLSNGQVIVQFNY